MRWFTMLALCVIGLVGCGADQSKKTTEKELASKKLAAINNLADVLTRDTSGSEAFAALDEFRNTDFNAKTHPEDAQKILDVYDQRIKGKYQGEIAKQLDVEINLFRKTLQR